MPNQRALVVRKDDQFSAALRAEGFDVLNIELIQTHPLADQSQCDKVLDRLDQFYAVIFTSPSAAEVFVERFRGKPSDIKPTIYALGDRASALLGDSGFSIGGGSAANTAADLITELGIEAFRGKPILYFRGNRSVGTIQELLGKTAKLTEVIVYETLDCEVDKGSISDIRCQLDREEIDWICFFSPSGVEQFCNIFNMVIPPKAAVIGETTAAAARANGFTVGVIADRPNNLDLAKKLIEQQKVLG